MAAESTARRSVSARRQTQQLSCVTDEASGNAGITIDIRSPKSPGLNQASGDDSQSASPSNGMRSPGASRRLHRQSSARLRGDNLVLSTPRAQKSRKSVKNLGVVQQPPSTRSRGGQRRKTLNSNQLLLETELMHLPLFSSCNSALVTDLATRIETSQYGRKQVVAEEGAVGESLILVRRGLVSMSIDGDTVGTIGVRKHFGETNLLAVDTHWKATLTCDSSAEISFLARPDFLQAMELFPVEGRTFENIRANHDNMACMWGGTIENRCEVFDGLTEKTLWAIDAKMVRRLIFQGDKIMQEGEFGSELLLLVQGRVDIMIAGRVVRQASAGESFDSRNEDTNALAAQQGSGSSLASPPQAPGRNSQRPSAVCMFGELGLLGMQDKASCSIVARSTCQVRVLYRSVLLRTLEQRQETLQKMPQFIRKHYSDKQTRVATADILRQVPPFKGMDCGDDFLRFLLDHLEDAIFLPGQTIVDAETIHDHSCCYFLAEGSAKVTPVVDANEHAEPRLLLPGEVIGDLRLVGGGGSEEVHGTVAAVELCLLQALHQSVLVRGLELFPDERSRILQASLESSAEDRQVGTQSVSRAPSLGANFVEVVKNTPLFLNTSHEFLDELSAQASTRIYLPNDSIIEQGQEGNSMFILVTGQAHVIVQDPILDGLSKQRDHHDAEEEAREPVQFREARVGSLSQGSVFGELTMLGISPTRSATIRAETVCFLWEITQDTALVTIERHPDAMKHFAGIVVHNLERTVQTRILNLPLFQGFDRKFRTLLSLYCERCVYFPRQRIVREGQVDERLIVFNIGRASLEKKGLMLRVYTQGTWFGAAVMLGLEKVYHGSLTVVQTCHILSVSRRSYLQALDRYPSTAAAQELKRIEQRQADEFRRALKQAHVRKKVWRSYEGATENVEAAQRIQGMVKDWFGSAITNEEDWLRGLMQGWHSLASQIRQKRQIKESERQKCQEQQNRWLERQVAARKLREDTQLSLQEDGMRSGMTSLAASRERLPAMPPKSARNERLKALQTQWPQPRRSPYYNLKFWCVLADAETELPSLDGASWSQQRPSQTQDSHCRAAATMPLSGSLSAR